MKTRLLIITMMFITSMIFSVSDSYAQASTETWSLTMENSYEIPINTENLTLDYIRAETNNNKILMYVSIDDGTKNGLIEFTFTAGSVSEIFSNPICTFDTAQTSSKFLVYVNQNIHETINADVIDGAIILSVVLPPDSSVVEIFSSCSTVLKADEVSKNSVNITADYESVKDKGRMMPINYYWYLPYLHWIYVSMIVGISVAIVFVIMRNRK